MSMTHQYADTAPARADIDALEGAAVLEFGTPWCGHCRAVQPLLAEALTDHSAVRHIKVEDGPGQPLGRSFKVKLWPTLIFLQDGQERARLVRPENALAIRQAIATIESAS